jgi:cyanate permease
MRRAPGSADEAVSAHPPSSNGRKARYPILAALEERWLILAVLVFARTAVGFQFQSVATLGPMLIDELGIDYALLGAIIGLFMLPGIVIALPGALLGQRFGDKRIVVIGLSLMTIGGLVLALGSEPNLYIAGRIVSGIGAVLLNVLVAKMVADWFAERDLAIALGFHLTSWPFGFGLALAVLAPLGEAAGSSAAMALTAAFTATALVLVLAFYRPPDDQSETKGTFRITLSSREWGLVVLAGIVWCCFNVSFVIVLAFAPDFLTDIGYSLSEAGVLSSLSMWVCVPALVLGGYMADRLGSPNAFAVALMSVGAAAGFGLTTGALPALWFVLLGLTLGFPAGPLMKLPVMVLSARNRSVGMGVFLSCFYAGMAALPPLAGSLRDMTGSPAAPIWFASGLMIAAIGFLMLFLIVEPRWKQNETAARGPRPSS